MDRATSRVANGYLFLPLLILLVLMLPGWRHACLTLYHLWEPHLEVPVGIAPSPTTPLRIRSDAYGRGEFGAKRRGKRRHAGIDLMAKLGDPVRAARSGWATVDYKKNGYGHFVTIQHLDGSETLYAHLSRVDIQNDQWLWQGQQIGAIGKTGNAGHYTGIVPHLHFEVRLDGTPIDPTPLLTIGAAMSSQKPTLAFLQRTFSPMHTVDAER